MQGVDPQAYMQQLAGRLNTLEERKEIETALDELEYLYEVMDPELQHAASDMIEHLRAKLQRLRDGES